MTAGSGNIQQLPLHSKHVEKGAKFGAFGVWEVPLYYTGILEEHEAVRARSGLFDISHMGEFWVSGLGAPDFLEGLLPRRVAGMKVGQALYMPLLHERGGIIDDIIVYRFAECGFLLIVNAGNIEKDYRWIESHVPQGVEFEDRSDSKGLLALQGPRSAEILQRAYGAGFSALPYYHFKEWSSGMIARTGYTGEDGFEIMVDQKDLPCVWEALVSAGKDGGLLPVGFGSRDTLRLEAGMPLYGHDLKDDTTPLEAGLGWAVDLSKPSFIGRDALAKQKENGVKRKLVGFEMIERGIPRQDYEIQKKGRAIGKVTSGSFSPTLKKNIGMGYVAVDVAALGNEIEIIVRDHSLKAKIVKLPFYKRQKS